MAGNYLESRGGQKIQRLDPPPSGDVLGRGRWRWTRVDEGFKAQWVAGAEVAGKRDRGRGVHGKFFPDFLPQKSPPTLRFDLQGWYRIEEGKEVKILGPVWWPEVAGPARYRRPKWSCYSESGREKEGPVGLGFPKWKPPKVKLAIYSKFFPTFVDHNFLIRTPI